MKQRPLSTRDDFESWLSSIDDFLDAFLASLPKDIRHQFDFSPRSLDAVEALILQTYPDAKSMLQADQSRFINWLAVYIGETFRKSLGGTWDIRLDDPTFAFAGMPILVGGPFDATPECPLTLATAAADRRTGDYIRGVLESFR